MNSNHHKEFVAKRVQLFLNVFLASIIDPQKNYSVSYHIGEQTLLFQIECDEMGVLLGKNGRTITQLRSLVESIGLRQGVRVVIDTAY